MSHTQAWMTVYKKAPAGTTVEVADGTILPVDGFGKVEVDLDQRSSTIKPVKVVSVAYVPGLPRNLLSTRNAVVFLDSRSSTTKRSLFWGFRKRGRLFLTSAHARHCFPQNM